MFERAVKVTDPLSVKFGRVSLHILKVTVYPALVDPVQLTLEAVEICLSQRPCLSKLQLLQLCADVE